MALLAPAFEVISPSFIEPGLIFPYAQASGAFETIAEGAPRVRLAEDDLVVYMKRVDLRTSMAAGTAGYNQLPGVSIAFSQISTPTYLLRVRAQWDHHDVSAAGHWGVSLPEAYRLGCRQGHFQLMRTALLFGFQPQNGEGLVNAAGATATNLPPDSNGNDTATSYDNGDMGLYLIQQIGLLKSRTNQLGIGREFTILGPQRILELFEYNVVQLVQYQRPGAGTTSTAGMVKENLMTNGDKLAWAYDDTLEGKGSGGADLVILSMPTVEKPIGAPAVNTNVFADLQPGIDVCSTMYSDLVAPREIISPMAGGATDMLTEIRITSGWAVRPEAITLISMVYQ
jgi:hypothetical protein